jgi:hypothetical protein
MNWHGTCQQGGEILAVMDSEEIEGKNTVIYYYDEPGQDDDVIFFNSILTKQKEAWISLGSITGTQAIRMCKVPEMQFLRDPSDSAVQALDEEMTRYQRPTDNSRKNDISTFFAQDENYLVNSALIWLPEMGDSVENLNGQTGKKERWEWGQADGNHPEEQQKLHPTSYGITQYRIGTESLSEDADPRNIKLQRECSNTITNDDGDEVICGQTNPEGYWFDVCPNVVCNWNGRPAHLIDGQHRCRGVATSEQPNEYIPVNFMEGNVFDETHRSKIFSEVNNNGKPLDPLHRLNIAYRTGTMVHTSGYQYNFDEQSQKRSYQVAARLTRGQPHVILKERIHLLPPHPGKSGRRGRMMGVDYFVRWSATEEQAHHSSDWFANNGPWRKKTNPRQKLSVVQASNSLSNFYLAFASVFDDPLWKNETSKNGETQKSWIVQSIFKMYPTTVAKIRDNNNVDIPSYDQFRTVLSHLGNLNFSKEEWMEFGSGITGSGQAAFDHRTKILKNLILTYDENLDPIPATINQWICTEPGITDLELSELTDIGNAGTTISWKSIVDEDHNPIQNEDLPPLLSKSGKALVQLLLNDEVIYEQSEPTNSHAIELRKVNHDDLTAGDQIVVKVTYSNINSANCSLSRNLNW